MSKKEKILWFLLILLVVIIFVFLLIVIYYNKNKNENFFEESNAVISNRLMSDIWTYSNSYYYPADSQSFESYYNYFYLKFVNDKIEFCNENGCTSSNYKIKDNVLTVDSIKEFSGDYLISFENEYLVLAYDYVNNGKTIYYFVPSVG